MRYVQVSWQLSRVQLTVTDLLLKYHTTSEYRDLAKKMSEVIGRPCLQYDGMVGGT